MLSGMLEKLGPVLQRGDSFKGAAEAGGVWDAGKLGPVLQRGDSFKVGGRSECCVGCRENWATFFNGATVLRVRLKRAVCGMQGKLGLSPTQPFWLCAGMAKFQGTIKQRVSSRRRPGSNFDVVWDARKIGPRSSTGRQF